MPYELRQWKKNSLTTTTKRAKSTDNELFRPIRWFPILHHSMLFIVIFCYIVFLLSDSSFWMCRYGDSLNRVLVVFQFICFVVCLLDIFCPHNPTSHIVPWLVTLLHIQYCCYKVLNTKCDRFRHRESFIWWTYENAHLRTECVWCAERVWLFVIRCVFIIVLYCDTVGLIKSSSHTMCVIVHLC